MKELKKKFFAAFLILFSALTFAATEKNSSGNSGKKSIVCTTFPEYDWVKNIIGEKNPNFELTLLQNKGADLHSYQPTIKDVAKISTCDMLVFVGGESDEWVEKAISNAKNKNMLVVNMLESLGDRVREEEVVEGMQAEEEESREGVLFHDHEHRASDPETDAGDKSQ